jgi:hypothetical protein
VRNNAANEPESTKEFPQRTPREIFKQLGYIPTPPSQLNEHQLPGRLWEFLYAAAGRSIFFLATNHLSDRDLYSLLYETWLEEPTDDIPLEEEVATLVMIADYAAGGMSREEIFYKYYANSADRKPGRSGVPTKSLPAPLRPPFDRDRFLPSLPDQPLENSINNSYDAYDSCDPDELEGDEEAGPTTPAIPLPAPGKLSDEKLEPLLWMLLHHLALRGVFVQHTDHLSDRELYAALWKHGLCDPMQLPETNKNSAIFHDFLGGWGAKETQIWLRYYASEDERESHAEDWPEDDIPPHEDPPFKRDWRLPKRLF